jgi:hypothetical protein
MCATATKTRKPLTPAPISYEWVRVPFGPTPDASGLHGILRIAGQPYNVWPLGLDTPAGRKVIGFELFHQLTGADYHIRLEWWGAECDCGDGTFRGGRPFGCKHIANLREAFKAIDWNITLPKKPA